MKKHLFLSSTAIAAAALTAFFCYRSFTPQLSEADILLNENIEALTDGENGEAKYYLHHFSCSFTVSTQAQANAILNLLGIKVKVGAFICLDNFTQYFNETPEGGEGPCEKGTQKTCYDVINTIL